MNMKGEARIAGAGSTEDVPACFSFGIVYLELSRRGGKVNIGKYGSTEVDFVTQKEGVLTYYQVTVDMTAEETFEREMRPLRSIHDNYEKIVLTLDRFSLGNYDGIKVMNVDYVSIGNANRARTITPSTVAVFLQINLWIVQAKSDGSEKPPLKISVSNCLLYDGFFLLPSCGRCFTFYSFVLHGRLWKLK